MRRKDGVGDAAVGNIIDDTVKREREQTRVVAWSDPRYAVENSLNTTGNLALLLEKALKVACGGGWLPGCRR